MAGGGGGYKCQLSVKWLLMINYETYLHILDAKFGLKGTYNLN